MASGILQDLVALIGHQPTIELLRAWGGRRIKVPATIGEDHPLVLVVGWDPAHKLSAAYGGADALDLPAERNHLIDLRNQAIAEGFHRRRSITWLANTYGVSRRQVNSILDRMGHGAERLERAAAVGSRT